MSYINRSTNQIAVVNSLRPSPSKDLSSDENTEKQVAIFIYTQLWLKSDCIALIYLLPKATRPATRVVQKLQNQLDENLR
jgi:hypothetical protein